MINIQAHGIRDHRPPFKSVQAHPYDEACLKISTASDDGDEDDVDVL